MKLYVRHVSESRGRYTEISKSIKLMMDTKASEMLLREHQKVVHKWKNQIDFEVQAELTSRGYAIYVDYADISENKVIWYSVNYGTKPRTIKPKKRGGVLAFPKSYKAKTRPGSLRSGRGGSSGPIVFAKKVNIKGIKARRFDKTIIKRAKGWFPNYMRRAIDDGRKKVA